MTDRQRLTVYWVAVICIVASMATAGYFFGRYVAWPYFWEPLVEDTIRAMVKPEALKPEEAR